jgi:hypothetical protein
MRRYLGFLVLLMAPLAFSQSYYRMPLQLQNPQGQAISGAKVYILTQPANTSSFTPLATLYSNGTGAASPLNCGPVNGSNQIANPVITNGHGEGCAYVMGAGNLYTVCYVSPYTGTQCYPDQSPVGGATGVLAPSAPSTSVQAANSTVTALVSDPNITLDTTTHTLKAQNEIGNNNSTVYVMASPYNAACDGATDDSGPIQAAITAAGNQGTVEFPPNKVCAAHGLTTSPLTQLDLHGSTLQLNLAGGTILTVPQSTGTVPNSKLGPSLRNGSFNCNSLTGSTVGIYVSSASFYVANVRAYGCATGLELYEGQYGEYHSVNLFSNTVGLKLYSDPTNGGGLDNSFYDAFIGYNQVGVIAWANSSFPLNDNNFYKLRMSVNSVAGFALIGNPADPSLAGVNVYGGYGEGDSSGSPSNIVIDGNTIKPATFYASYGTINANNFGSDSTPQYLYRLENSSSLILFNGGGYGNTTGYYVSADPTSNVYMDGPVGGDGVYQNVATWPSNILFNYAMMTGSPISTVDPSTVNAYTGNPFTIGFALVSGGITTSTVTDPQFGSVSQAIFAPTPGNVSANRVTLGSSGSGVFPTVPTTVASTYLVSVMVKASVNCSFTVRAESTASTPYFSISPNLVAGQWTRIVLAQISVASGVQINIGAFPNDSTGPTVQFANLEMIALPAQAPATIQAVAHVLRDGAVGPNGFKPFITSLTTIGSSGPATVTAGVLNIPQYTGGTGSGTVSNCSTQYAFFYAAVTGTTATCDGNLTDNGTQFVFALPLSISGTGASQIAFTYNATPLVPGSSTTAVVGANSSGQGVLSEAGAAAGRICTATNGVCPGGSGSINPGYCTTSVGNQLCVTDSTYNASGSGATTTTVSGTWTAGTSGSVASCSTFSSANQGVYIAGAGAAGAAYIGAVVSCTGTTMTVTPATSTTVSSSNVVQHDETAAFQSALNYFGTNVAGGNIWVNDGIYLVNGPLQDTGHANANGKLLVPSIEYGLSSPVPVSIGIKGFTQPTQTGITQGAIIQTAGTSGNLIGGTHDAGGPFGIFTNVYLTMENVTLRSYLNPTINMLNAGYIAGLRLNHVWFDAGLTISTPSSAVGVALTEPYTLNSAFVQLDDVTTIGYGTGIIFGEHSVSHSLYAANEFNCYVFDVGANGLGGTTNSVNVGYLWAQSCTNQIVGPSSSQPTTVNIQNADIESATSHGVNDPNNLLRGTINYHVPGSSGPVSTVGATGVCLFNLDFPNNSIGCPGGAVQGTSFTTEPSAPWAITNFQASGAANMGVQSGSGTWAFLTASSAGNPGFIWDSSHSFSLATSTATSGAGFNPLFVLQASGVFSFASLAGTGNRYLQADASGNVTATGAVTLSGTTSSIGGGALLVNACATGTATITGISSAMVIQVTPVSDPNGSTAQNYDWYGYMSAANTVTVKVCALVAGTPTATTYNVRAIP